MGVTKTVFKIIDHTQVRAARQSLGLSQSHVASQLGITQAMLSAYELGRAQLRPAEQAALVKILGLHHGR